MKILVFLLFISSDISAENKKNIPQTLTIENSSYSLCKEHTIRYAFVIKIAYVGLYLEDCTTDQDLLTQSDKLIRFNYQVDVKAKVFIDAAEEFFVKNSTQPGEQELQELKRFNQFYENINDSDYYDLYHQQGKILKLLKNTKLLGSSENTGFAFKYFNIWFGKYPAVKPLKKAFMS